MLAVGIRRSSGSALTSLDLSNNGINAGGALWIAESLREQLPYHARLEPELDWGPGASKLLPGTDWRSGSSPTLSLSRTGLGSSALQLFADALRSSRYLTSLHSSCNSFRYAGPEVLACLCGNTTLASLSLQETEINQESMRALDGHASEYLVLTRLNLHRVWQPDGGVAIGSLLRTNSTLTSLNVSRSGIVPQGAMAFADALSRNSTLIRLHLQENTIGAVVLAEFSNSSCVSANTLLTTRAWDCRTSSANMRLAT